MVIKDLLGQQGPQYGISLCTLKANPSEEEICSLLVTIRRIRLPNSIYQLWSSFTEASFYTANHMVFEQNNKARYLMIVPTLFDENWMPNALVKTGDVLREVKPGFIVLKRPGLAIPSAMNISCTCGNLVLVQHQPRVISNDILTLSRK